MKKFIISVLCVSVFFIGLGGIVDRTAANFKSDPQALELIKRARAAIGGDANIEKVRGMTITANTTNFFEMDGIARSEQGNLEINLEFPNRYGKMLKIGDPGAAGANADMRREMDVVIVKNGGENVNIRGAEDGKKVVIVKKDDGTVLTENIEPGTDGEKRIIIKKDDGTVISDKIVGTGGAGTFTTEDGKTIKIDKNIRVAHGAAPHQQNEMLRMTLALLLTAPEGMDVNYSYKGESSVDGFSVNVVEAQTGGSAVKLFLDKSSNLPRMISFMGADFPKIMKFTGEGGKTSPEKDVKIFVRTPEESASVEHQIKFSDYRSVEGVLLPFAWTETIAGKQSQNTNVSSYEINPANIADKFKPHTIFIKKPENK